MAIKAIIFDCFGVLVMSTHASLKHDFPHLSEELEDLRKRSDYGYISRPDFDQELADLIGVPVATVEEGYWDKNARNDSVFTWIKDLKKSGLYKLGLLSNIGQGWLDDFIPENERRELFDAEILSGVVGMTKPDPAIFTLMAEKLGCDASECVMIDDILENIDGASHADMLGVVYATTDQAKADLDRIIAEHA